MKSFEYAEPRTEAEVVEFLQGSSGESVVLAGGTDLTPLLKSSIERPQRVVNIMEVESLKAIRSLDDGSTVIGAATTLDEILASPRASEYQALVDAIHGINSMQLQSQGTLGGELLRRPTCWYFRQHGSLLAGDEVARGDNRYHAVLGNHGPAKFVSASRIAPAMIALDAHARVVSAAGERWLPVADLYRIPRRPGERETTLAAGEFVSHFVLPPPSGLYSATYEVRQSVGPDMPLAAAAASLQWAAGRVTHATIVLGQVAPVPWLADRAARHLVGKPVDPELATEAGEVAVAQAHPLSENEYKIQLAAVAVKRAVLRAAGLETGGLD